MENLSKKYIDDHKNPIKKIDLPGIKEFLLTEKHEECDKYLKNIEITLKQNRVDRRCARSKAVWLADEQVAKIIKTIGSLHHYGYQNTHGKFLYPEEILYLLEINKLEVVYNEIPMSIQESFEKFLKNGLNLEKYLIYKKLTMQGYRLVKTLKSETNRNDDHTEERCCKIRKLDDDDTNAKFAQIFERLHQKAPKNIKHQPETSNPDYYLFLPHNTNNKPDFCLFIINRNQSIDTISNNCPIGIPKIFALFTENQEFIGFYRCENVDIPCL